MEPVHATDPTATAPDALPEEVRKEVEGLVTKFTKALKAYRLYLPTHRTLLGFVESFHSALETFLETSGDVCFRVLQTRITYEEEVVYENDVKEESLSFRLFINGVREFSFHRGIPIEEVTAFLEVIHQTYDAKSSADDILTLLWERDLKYITFIVIDDFFEEDEQTEFDEFVDEGRRADDTAPPVRQATRPILDRLLANDDASLPLDSDRLELVEEEVSRLAGWVREERQRDLVRQLCAALLELLDTGAPDEDRREVLLVLDRILESRLAEGRLHESIRVIEQLRTLRQDEPAGTAARAVLDDALGRFGGERMVKLFEPHLPGTGEEELELLVDFVASLDASTVPALLDLLEKPETREFATRSLKRVAPKHVDRLILRLRDANPPVAVAILRLIGDGKDPRALPALKGPMTSPDPAIRREAIRTIGAIGTEAAFPLLTDVLSDPDREIRILAVRALAGLPADVVRHQLFELARAKEFSRRTWFEKKEIFLALASAADPEIEDWITSVVRKRRWFHREENDELRAGAVGALARLGNPTAMAIVRDALEDRSPQVRRAAAQALRPTGEH